MRKTTALLQGQVFGMAVKHILLIGALVCCASAIPHFEPVDRAISALESAEEKIKSRIHDIFVNWKSKFNRLYDGSEHEGRFEIFRSNYEIIEKHNALFSLGEETFELGLNQFSDMTNDEYKKILGFNPSLRKLSSGLNLGKACTHDVVVVNASVDWRVQGAVSEVKNQGQCGSCWSFSTTGAVEGAWAVAGNPLVSLSEEELVQCDTASDQGCNGGLMDNAYQWIIENGGLAGEEVYPYVSGNGTTGVCKKPKLKVKVAHISDYCDLAPGSEKDLEKAVNQQPIAVAIEADQPAFQMYSGGVVPVKKCGKALDHGVLLVGYGHDAKLKMDYWIVKNSWGGLWGESGYIRLQKMPAKAKHSTCGIAEAGSYPVV